MKVRVAFCDDGGSSAFSRDSSHTFNKGTNIMSVKFV